MDIRVAGFTKESTVDGPGIRSVVYAQGCLHNCPGCHNPDTHDLNAGQLLSVDEVFELVLSSKLASGVTFSGGDPFFQPLAFAELGRRLRARGRNIAVYTGFTWEELVKRNKPEEFQLLKTADLLIDGPFILELRDLSLPFRGSRNQRIINVAESFRCGFPAICDRLDDVSAIA